MFNFGKITGRTPKLPAKRPELVQPPVQQRREALERTLALAGAAENPVFKAILAYADEHARNEHESAIAANLGNETRQYNAGRSASAYDLAYALRDIQAKAEAAAVKLKAD